MGEQPVVRFQNVSKRFAFRPDRPHTILETLTSLFSGGAESEQDLWAVRDVTFDVMPGQCLGIIGRNGSGKSTILKLIARILRPTSGQVLTRGRVSALLELGAGFHQDLTGRENIYLNASVLGLTKEEVDACFDDIVAFSELGQYIDMPVKHYSSGMYMRLGFSVAIHVKPDILIVDEILAVGDQDFQTKCIDRIYEMKRGGTTIILVSHNLAMIRTLSSHLIWIEHGEVQGMGSVEEMIAQYKASSYKQKEPSLASAKGPDPFQRWGNGDVEITAVRFLDADGDERRTFRTGDPMTIEMAYTAHKPVQEPEFGLAIYRQDGIHVNGPNNRLAGLQTGVVEGAGIVRYHVERLPLLPARYVVTVAVHDGRMAHTYDYHNQAYDFEIVVGGTRETDGLVELAATWEWEPVQQHYQSANHPSLETEKNVF